jgi:hypothetical protein
VAAAAITATVDSNVDFSFGFLMSSPFASQNDL